MRPACEAVHLSLSAGRGSRSWRGSHSGFRPRSILYKWRRRRRTSQFASTPAVLVDLFVKQKGNDIATLGSIPASCSVSAPPDHRSGGDLWATSPSIKSFSNLVRFILLFSNPR
jgi:hypothetical protein